MANSAWIIIKKFNDDHLAYGIHKRLELFIEQYRSRHLNYYIAHLSHEIYPNHGIRGHFVRQKIRRDLKIYAYGLLKEKERADNIRRGYPVPKEQAPYNKLKPIQSWLYALLLVFGLLITGIGISIFTNSLIPFWVLFGFSVIFSIEKWF